MKYLIIILLLLMPLVYADEEILDATLKSPSTFKLNDLEYNFHFSQSSDKALIEGKYLKFILDSDECKIQGYYTFCLTNATEYMEEFTEYKLEVTEASCLEYTVDNSTCKVKIGEACETNAECEGNKCLHNICTFRYPICGDTFCDENEKCDEDCKVKINETNTTEEIIVEPEVIAEPEPTPEPEEPIPDFHTTKEEPVVEEKQVIVETLQEEEPANMNNVIIWISIIAIVLVIAYVIGITIYKKRKNTFEL